MFKSALCLSLLVVATACAHQQRLPAADSAPTETRAIQFSGKSSSVTVRGVEISVYLLPDEAAANCLRSGALRPSGSGRYLCSLKSHTVGDVSHAVLVSPTNRFKMFENPATGEAMIVTCHADRIDIEVLAADLYHAENVIAREMSEANMSKVQLVEFIKPN